jgi:hypothetical protein
VLVMGFRKLEGEGCVSWVRSRFLEEFLRTHIYMMKTTF